MPVKGKESVKNLLGQVPFTAELYWLVRQRGKPIKSRFSLKGLENALPELVQEGQSFKEKAEPGKKVFIFASLHYWIEHAALLGIMLSAQGHDVSFGYLPYADWQKPINRFDLRRQNAYARKVLGQADDLMKIIPFLNVRASYKALPEKVQELITQVSIYDSQYTLQNEVVDLECEICQLRLKRNEEAARIALAVLKENRPDVVIVPNGTIQELGVVYRVARFLEIPTVTYEFGDQRERIWVGQNTEIMRQETDAMWEARKDIPFSNKQMKKIKDMFDARQQGNLWKNFSRLWQDGPTKGKQEVREKLGLDDRPVILLATNVLGDSLTLGREVFSQSMASWISRTVQYFIGRPDVQLVIRVHPGEALTHGQSMVDVVHSVMPQLPEHIHLIAPDEKVNTYDLIDLSDLGLVYTTTVGLEMAMTGLPVIVSGQTHYRNRGFTHDPDSWVRYFKLIGKILEDPQAFRLSQEQVEKSWQYAYRFFFEFPRPFPWHLVRVWNDYEEHKLSDVLSTKGLETYGKTFQYLIGEKIDWENLSD